MIDFMCKFVDRFISGFVILANYYAWKGRIIFKLNFPSFVTSCINRICIPYLFLNEYMRSMAC